MEDKSLDLIINEALLKIALFRKEYLRQPEDQVISEGNVAICIIAEDGSVYGRMYGTNKSRLRQSYKIAWTKASQVWLTGVKTGEYERMVFNKEVDENGNGIEAPDLIGWEGGQPVTLSSGTKLSIGFSGFRGVTDLEIVVRAFEETVNNYLL